jgi:hypothetical protein
MTAENVSPHPEQQREPQDPDEEDDHRPKDVEKWVAGGDH